MFTFHSSCTHTPWKKNKKKKTRKHGHFLDNRLKIDQFEADSVPRLFSKKNDLELGDEDIIYLKLVSSSGIQRKVIIMFFVLVLRSLNNSFALSCGTNSWNFPRIGFLFAVSKSWNYEYSYCVIEFMEKFSWDRCTVASFLGWFNNLEKCRSWIFLRVKRCDQQPQKYDVFILPLLVSP